MAASNIEARLGLEVFCPQIRFRRKTVRGAVWFQEAMFPGYIFVRLDLAEMKRAVIHAPGVMSIPSFDERCISIPEALIESLKAGLNEDQVAPEEKTPFEVGDSAIIVDGSMCGLKVEIIRLLPATQRVAVLFELMGTLVKAEIAVSAIERED